MKNDFIRKELQRAPQKLFLLGTLTVAEADFKKPKQVSVTKKKMQLCHWLGIDVNELPMHPYRYDKWRDIVLVS
jgi:hypothetical protein